MALEQHAAASAILQSAVADAPSIQLNRGKTDSADLESIQKLGHSLELARTDPDSLSMTATLEQLAREMVDAAVNRVLGADTRHAGLMQDILDHETNTSIGIFVPHCESPMDVQVHQKLQQLRARIEGGSGAVGLPRFLQALQTLGSDALNGKNHSILHYNSVI
eukprot:COSAG05_NODE_227_length_13407_cov_32.277953_7_plen_164_part_00